MICMIRVVDYENGEWKEPCILLLGYFDGMHVGHRKLLERAKCLAREKNCTVGLMTFYDGKSGGQIYLFEERLYLFEKLGANFVYAAHFNDAFRATDGVSFLAHILSALNVKAFVCGADFTFGKGAACGTPELQNFCREHKIESVVCPLVALRGEKAAASLAKRYLREGETEKLAELLGARYFIRGRVSTEGRQVGRKMGFPTANIHLPPEKYPLKSGVYAVTAEIDGAQYRGIANYGPRPTFEDGRIVFEVYLDGFTGDLYGQTITVYFDFYIRDIRKFASAEALANQLKIDLEKIR